MPPAHRRAVLGMAESDAIVFSSGAIVSTSDKRPRLNCRSICNNSDSSLSGWPARRTLKSTPEFEGPRDRLKKSGEPIERPLFGFGVENLVVGGPVCECQ